MTTLVPRPAAASTAPPAAVAQASTGPLPSFGQIIADLAAEGDLVVQPRMGFSDPALMREGLLATRGARAATVGTLTLDSYTRVGDHDAVLKAMANDTDLNGYPLVDHDAAVTAAVLDGVPSPRFPIQVRHGSADPRRIISTMLGLGLSATEGGPISYCLPYSRMPLTRAAEYWKQACETLAEARTSDREPHLETFGGCMMGQLCPPSLLVALSVLEGLFFWQHGVTSISLSYAQQTHSGQDEEAVAALRRLCDEYLPFARTHIVVYTYMGVYPRTVGGARALLAESAQLAVRSGAQRVIVKTTAEAHRIPTVGENIAALEYAAASARGAARRPAPEDTGIHAQAKTLIDNVLSLDGRLDRALPRAFALGHLDVPFCLHPDNQGRTRAFLDPDGRLLWQRIGALPIGGLVDLPATERLTSAGLLAALRFTQTRFDERFGDDRSAPPREITSETTREIRSLK